MQTAVLSAQTAIAVALLIAVLERWRNARRHPSKWNYITLAVAMIACVAHPLVWAANSSRISRLESASLPRTLSSESAAAILGVLRSAAPASLALHAQPSDAEAILYAGAFEALLQEVHWNVVRENAQWSYPPPPGITVRHGPPCAQTAVVLSGALRAGGLSVRVEERKELGNYVVLIVGARPVGSE